MDDEEAMKNMWIELISYVTKKEDANRDDLVALLGKSVLILGVYLF